MKNKQIFGGKKIGVYFSPNNLSLYDWVLEATARADIGLSKFVVLAVKEKREREIKEALNGERIRSNA